MKKIISLILCLVFATFAFAGCRKDDIGEDLDDSMRGYVKDNLTLNFYIIGDPTNDNATVNARINNYAKSYNTALNIVYCTEDGYSEKVITALDSAKTAIESQATDEASLNAIKNKPDFFLINSPEMMKALYEKGHLADITEFFNPALYEKRVEIHPEEKNKFHAELIKKTEKLQNTIAESLMDASIILEDIYDETTKQTLTHEKNYCVPNNRVVGSYTYLLIHRDTAEEVGYVGSKAQLASFKTYESTEALRDAIEAKGLNPDDYVKEVTGRYEDKAMYEQGTYPGDDKKYACNIVSYPQVAGLDVVGIENVPATVDNVFNSAFAVGKYSDLDRCMEMIYALNTDATLYNLLQYGVQDTNYTIDAKTGLVDYSQINQEENKYLMSPIYTGNMLNEDLLESASWTKNDKANAKSQNEQSSVYKVDK